MSTLQPLAALLGRILLSAIFILAGFSKIGGYEGTAAYMGAAGVPAVLLPLVIALELGGGFLILVGLFSRPAALLLAGFSIATALLFHNTFLDPSQYNNFMKNLAIAGGLLMLFAQGPGALAVRE